MAFNLVRLSNYFLYGIDSMVMTSGENPVICHVRTLIQVALICKTRSTKSCS